MLYVSATTEQNDIIFAECGSKTIAGNAANTGSVAGKDFCLVHSAHLNVEQPHDHQTSDYHTAQHQHNLTLVVPNYQPLQAMLMNVINERKVIATLTLNTAQRHAKGQSLMGQTIAKKGILANYVLGFETGSDIALTFHFEQLTHDNKLTQTSGALYPAIAA